jgi:hypothetical protein
LAVDASLPRALAARQPCLVEAAALEQIILERTYLQILVDGGGALGMRQRCVMTPNAHSGIDERKGERAREREEQWIESEPEIGRKSDK